MHDPSNLFCRCNACLSGPGLPLGNSIHPKPRVRKQETALQRFKRVVTETRRSNWYTLDGERIEIGKMSDSHLVNTIRYLRRKARIEFYLAHEQAPDLKYPEDLHELASETYHE